MKAKLIVNGKEIEVEISEKEAEALTKTKRTGYERVEADEAFFVVDSDGTISGDTEEFHTVDEKHFEIGNYYSDLTIAENNARADKLMRQLRRFAVEHREKNLTWKENPKKMVHLL